MKSWKTTLCMTVAVGILGACSAPTEEENKPSVDPDAALASMERADGLSNHYTTIVGEITTDDVVSGYIDYPDYFHGYLVDLEANQELQLKIAASADGWFRVYGPARMRSGTPKFGAPLADAVLNYDRGRFRATTAVTAEETGTYMVLYGPAFVWEAEFEISTACPTCNLMPGQCLSDSECAAGEFCGDNGVRCITFPCTANYDICQPAVDPGAFCDRDEMCGADAVCAGGVCTTQGTDECAANSDCADGFCGWDEARTRICKPFSAEGESCGGFVRPQDVRMCEPDLGCVAPNFIADIPGRCGQFVTVAELAANPSEYDGRYVAVEGHVFAGPAMCTLMACTVDNPCCNSCGASQLLGDTKGDPNGIHVSDASGNEYGCGGNNCNVYDNCETPNGKYFLSGTFEVGRFGVQKLTVDRQFSAP